MAPCEKRGGPEREGAEWHLEAYFLTQTDEGRKARPRAAVQQHRCHIAGPSLNSAFLDIQVWHRMRMAMRDGSLVALSRRSGRTFMPLHKIGVLDTV